MQHIALGRSDLQVSPICLGTMTFGEQVDRASGIGRALLSHLAALAAARGCGRFEWSVLDWNENAIRFYEKMGATVMPDWRICRITGDALQRFAKP